ncbi:SAM-dependent methyltransferase [Glycomyces sp. NRRL B-16210]|uniref:SAM-dependent methyltransferase n=1 Tax=Glycomyces sp. NRRL B-16210 TaxID=1463821 RepID=UPI0018CC366A|nr:SAM-dependent methyltransferase [Glycomyces sp. NRRL B-16210]
MFHEQRIVVSAAEESLPLAIRELELDFGPEAKVEPIGPEMAVITAPGLTAQEVADRCEAAPLVFPRHLTVETALLDADADLDRIAEAALAAVRQADLPKSFALQVWVSGRSSYEFGPAAAFGAIAGELDAAGYTVAKSRRDHVLSCCLTPRGVLLGLNETRDSLSDWPGGGVRLSKGRDQISRAEFKLEEALGEFGLDLPKGGNALDLGAAPGGWTRILRGRGLRVWAVDPGDLDERLSRDGQIKHLKLTAGRFLRSNRTVFDVAVNDMRMDPKLSTELMVRAAEHLAPGALAIVTLKTGSREVLTTVQACLALLTGPYEVLHARQLRHNRHEITVVARRTDAPAAA